MNLTFCVSRMNAYSFNTNSKSKKIAKTMIFIHFKVKNCQVVLPINATMLNSEDRPENFAEIQFSPTTNRLLIISWLLLSDPQNFNQTCNEVHTSA